MRRGKPPVVRLAHDMSYEATSAPVRPARLTGMTLGSKVGRAAARQLEHDILIYAYIIGHPLRCFVRRLELAVAQRGEIQAC